MSWALPISFWTVEKSKAEVVGARWLEDVGQRAERGLREMPSDLLL